MDSVARLEASPYEASLYALAARIRVLRMWHERNTLTKTRWTIVVRTASLLPYLSVLAACSATQTYAGPRQVLRELYRLHHKEYVSSEVTSPEYHERIKLYRLMFHARDNGKVRRLLAANLTTERGWAISVVMQGQRIEYDRRNESVEYLSEVQYNLIERGIDNPGWYPNGKPAPRAYRGGCVVQYFKTRR